VGASSPVNIIGPWLLLYLERRRMVAYVDSPQYQYTDVISFTIDRASQKNEMVMLHVCT
jgi:hypothetical protein